MIKTRFGLPLIILIAVVSHPAHAAKSMLSRFIPDLAGIAFHQNHIFPTVPIPGILIDTQEPGKLPTVLVNEATNLFMLQDSTPTNFFSVFYNSADPLPSGSERIAAIFGDIDSTNNSSFRVEIWPAHSFGFTGNSPVLRVFVSNSVDKNVEFLTPNMITFDGHPHNFMFGITVGNDGKFNYKVSEDRNTAYTYVTQTRLNGVVQSGASPPGTTIPAFNIPWKTSPVDNKPYTYYVGQIVASISNQDGVHGFYPPNTTNLYAFDGELNQLYWWPNTAVDVFNVVLQNIFQQPDGRATPLPANGANILVPGQVPAPVLLDGDSTRFGFEFNGGITNGKPASFVVPLGEFAPPLPASSSPY